MQRVAVVIPTHKEQLDELEKISLAQCYKVLGHYPIIFAIPEGKDFAWIPEGRQVIHLPYLGGGTNQYNILLKSPQFYEPFLDYEYILIYHTDAFVFYDALEYFCSLGYDYIGAPWSVWLPWMRINTKFLSRVGNGGFCLRKVKACYNLLSKYLEATDKISEEDIFFSYCGKRADLVFNVAPYAVACKFAAETNPSRVIKKNGGHFPFGCHKWFDYNADVFINFFLKLGYDLRPLKSQLYNQNFASVIRQGLYEEATKRLIRRVENGQPFLKYLPTKRFATVKIIRNPVTEKILKKIISIYKSPKIFSYDNMEDLTNGWTVEKLPHLLITLEDEAPLLAALNKAGLRYGKHVISFRQEYLKYCEKLFHNLGR